MAVLARFLKSSADWDFERQPEQMSSGLFE